MSSPVKVQIYGQTYTIHGELEPGYVQTLATFVDDKMRAIADAPPLSIPIRSQCWLRCRLPTSS